MMSVPKIDKLSLPLTIALAMIFLGEPLGWRLGVGIALSGITTAAGRILARERVQHHTMLFESPELTRDCRFPFVTNSACQCERSRR